MGINICYVFGGDMDWEGVYIGGELVTQNHSVDWREVMGQLRDTHVGSYMELDLGDEYWEEHSELPQHFGDIPEKYFG